MQGAISSLNSQLDQNKQFIGAAYDAAKKATGNDVLSMGVVLQMMLSRHLNKIMQALVYLQVFKKS